MISYEQNHRPVHTVLANFKDKNLIETRVNNDGHVKMQVPKKINGIVQKCFCIKEVTDEGVISDANPLN